MELRQLRYFVAVAKEGHFGRAALQLNIAQPAVSRAIQLLERELGVELFERLPRGVRLAEAGQRYLHDVERILNELSHASEDVKEALIHEHCEVSVGQAVMNLCHDDFLDGVLERFCRARPGNKVRLQLLNSLEQQHAIRERSIDVGFGYLAGEPIKGVYAKRLHHDPLCGIRVGEGSPIVARCARPRASDLNDEPLFMFRRSRNPQVFDYIVQCVQAAGFAGPVMQNAEFSFWHWRFMSKDSGWMLCTRSQMQAIVPGTVCLPLDEAPIPYGLDFVWGEHTNSAVVRAFFAAATEPRGVASC